MPNSFIKCILNIIKTKKSNNHAFISKSNSLSWNFRRYRFDLKCFMHESCLFIINHYFFQRTRIRSESDTILVTSQPGQTIYQSIQKQKVPSRGDLVCDTSVYSYNWIIPRCNHQSNANNNDQSCLKNYKTQRPLFNDCMGEVHRSQISSRLRNNGSCHAYRSPLYWPRPIISSYK